MGFAHPEMLLLLIGAPLYWLAAWLLGLFGERRLARLLPSAEQRRALNTADPRRRLWRRLLLALALVFIVLAAARPRFGVEYQEIERRGVDLVLAIDVSASMLARDAAPDRLGQAKVVAKKLLDKLGGDRVAVMPFAGGSVLRWPLSLDYGAAEMLIDSLQADAAPRAGTALKTAVEGALSLFQKTETTEKVLVILSDGEDHGGDLQKVVAKAKEAGLKIYAIGLGGRNAVPIPIVENDQEAFKRDGKGDIVYTRLEPENLQLLAAETGGLFRYGDYRDESIGDLTEALAKLTGRDLKSATVMMYKERYQWFLIPAIVLLAGEAVLNRRKRSKP